MNDKFILMGLDDERSKDVAEVLGNKTCKKILDFLTEIKEASEKDISEGLKIPINTVEYNLNKLIRSGLVEKTKNFFWSRKGRRIDLYKLARKHIIISPNKKFDVNVLKAILPVLIAAFVIIAFALYLDMKEIKYNSFNLNEDIRAGSSLQTTPSGDLTPTSGENIPTISVDKKNLDENYVKDKLLAIVEVILLLIIIIFLFLLFRKKK